MRHSPAADMHKRVSQAETGSCCNASSLQYTSLGKRLFGGKLEAHTHTHTTRCPGDDCSVQCWQAQQTKQPRA